MGKEKRALQNGRKACIIQSSQHRCAGVMELVDVLDSKSSAARRAGSSPATGTIMNESRFSNHFIEKRDLLYPESLDIWCFPLFHILTLLFQNALNAKLIFSHKVRI